MRKYKGVNKRLPSKAESTKVMRDTAATTACPLSEPSRIQYAQRHTEAIQKPHHVNRSARQVRYLARYFGKDTVELSRQSYTEQSDQAKQAACRLQTGQRRTSDPILEEESKRRHLLHQQLLGKGSAATSLG